MTGRGKRISVSRFSCGLMVHRSGSNCPASGPQYRNGLARYNDHSNRVRIRLPGQQISAVVDCTNSANPCTITRTGQHGANFGSTFTFSAGGSAQAVPAALRSVLPLVVKWNPLRLREQQADKHKEDFLIGMSLDQEAYFPIRLPSLQHEWGPSICEAAGTRVAAECHMQATIASQCLSETPTSEVNLNTLRLARMHIFDGILDPACQVILNTSSVARQDEIISAKIPRHLVRSHSGFHEPLRDTKRPSTIHRYGSRTRTNVRHGLVTNAFRFVPSCYPMHFH
ncbi:hypothetical protein AC579_8063 [Pseudocercospora musae]|uniref:Uncharacterized protein n=1 Tax=Pseudocercospora musae TaxID=113226 RepID=A0A139HHL4_9PEZI|nr:hypothetical protein AC579_8063 [Pseudocercospora musae]